MKVLATTTAINKELARLLRECVKCRIAVAWASTGFGAFSVLKRYSRKIETMVVGTHFFQTHPAFIAAFSTDPKVTFVKNTDELFHPKVYFFERLGGAWECIVGSPNFTHGGFGTNDEMAVLVTSEDHGASAALDRINAAIQAYLDKASPFSDEEYEGLRRGLEAQTTTLEEAKWEVWQSER